MTKRWWLPYERPACPACNRSGMVLADKTRERERRSDPKLGTLVRLRCSDTACGKEATFTATSPARHVDRRRVLKIEIPGIDRDNIRCSACGGRLHLAKQRLDRAQYQFKCNRNDIHCSQRRRAQWFVLRGKKLERASPQEIFADVIAARRAPRLKVPFNRECPTCHSPRIVHRWKSKLIGDAFRAYCRTSTCKKSTVYTPQGRFARPAQLQRARMELPFDRPRCRCGAVKTVGGRRFKHKILGDLITFVCRRCPWVQSRELWTAAGRPLTADEMRLANTQGRWRTTNLRFDRTTFRCERCSRAMQYGGRLRRVGTGQPHLFFCDHGHPRVTRLCDDHGRPVQVERGIKRFPWGKRPGCPECQTPLRSDGEWQGEDGRHFFRLHCHKQTCPVRRLYYDEAGIVVPPPRRLFRRPRPRPEVRTPGAKRLCNACRNKPVAIPEDRRSKYCLDCAELGSTTVWKKAQVTKYGPLGARLRARVTSGEAIKKLRGECGATQKGLAQRAGLSLVLIKKIEQGERGLTKHTKEKVVHAFVTLQPGAARNATGV